MAEKDVRMLQSIERSPTMPLTKTKKRHVLSVLLTLGGLAFAQSNPSLEIGGLTFRLGTAKAVALSQFPDYYMLLAAKEPNQLYGKNHDPLGTVPDGMVLALCDNPPANCHGDIEFKNGRLVYAARYWTNDRDTQEGGLTAAVNGLTAVSEKTQSCRVEAHQKTLPDHRDRYVWIFCGDHALIISSSTYSYQGKESPMLNVKEEIGDE